MNMRENPAQHRARRWQLSLYQGVPLLVLAALSLGGCSTRRSPGISWARAVQVKPMLPATAVVANDSTMDPPVFNLNVPLAAAILIPLHAAPSKPRASAPSPAGAAADPAKPDGPKLALQLTPEQMAAARQETNQSLDIAEKNLAIARGKTLNPAEADLVSKIKSFLKDAREAAQANDWARARSLAKKAQVLSDQLAQSL